MEESNHFIEELLGHMTLEEKISLLAGKDQWHTVPIERLNIPSLKVTDGPNGVRGTNETTGPTSASFPVGVAMGATWNPALISRVGQALAEETRAKSAHILLGPTVNIPRTPLAGRNFECFSEDPFLSGRLVVAYVEGLQGEGVGACVKHYVCNDSEFERFSISSEVGERALREIYLPPFRAAVEEAGTWTIMSAYNRINGTYASEHDYLLLEILKGEWGFDGVVISDWYGTYSENSVGSGLDLEMPGPARWMGEKARKVVQSGKVSELAIDNKVTRLLRAMARTGAFENPDRPEESVDRPEHRQLIREVGREAIVLLKNEKGLLPLLNDLGSIAVIGANAYETQFQGGGSSQVSPHYLISPLEAIKARVKEGCEIHYGLGCAVQKQIPLIQTDWMEDEEGSSGGLTLRYFDNTNLVGESVHTQMTRQSQVAWFGTNLEYGDPQAFSISLSGNLSVPESGRHTLSLGCVGKSRLILEGEEQIDLWDNRPEDHLPHQMIERSIEIELHQGRKYDLRVEYASEPGTYWRTVRLGCMPTLPEDPVGRAAALAAEADVAVVFAGLTAEWETEGFDRESMDLPGDQNDLIERVASANPRTIVVLNCGSPVHMPWIDRVPAVLQMWYLGQETGHAATDVLFGDVNPSGKLPTTFPRRIEDNPTYIHYPGENGKVRYGEDIFVGYRYYDKKDIEPLFPFGHGLSYTTFEYTGLRLEKETFSPGETIQVHVVVQNTGSRSGKEVVQLYLRDMESSLMRPDKELKAFAKIDLNPGESKEITFALDQNTLAFYDDVKKRWVAEPGDFEVLVGGSSRDIRLKDHFKLEELEDTSAGSNSLGVGSPLRVLFEDERAAAILQKHLDDILDMQDLVGYSDLSLEEVHKIEPRGVTIAMLKIIQEELEKL